MVFIYERKKFFLSLKNMHLLHYPEKLSDILSDLLYAKKVVLYKHMFLSEDHIYFHQTDEMAKAGM